MVDSEDTVPTRAVGAVAEQARAYFDEFAADYDEAATEAKWMPNDLLGQVLGSVGTVATAADLACGTGSTLAVLRRTFPGADLVGVDLSAPMIDRARARVPDVDYTVADIGVYATGTRLQFDLVTVVGGFEFTDHLPELLHAVRNLVRPGGHLVFTYEPVIAGWPPQSNRVETNLGSNGLELTTFRWDPDEVTAGFGGWDLRGSRLFAAYLRDGLPTVYGWLHYRRGS
jgi:predicted TPR repeat methyltransferase